MSSRKFIPVKSPDKRRKHKLRTQQGLVADTKVVTDKNRKYTFQEIMPSMDTASSRDKGKRKKRDRKRSPVNIKGLTGMVDSQVDQFNILDLVKDSSQTAKYVNKKAFFQAGKKAKIDLPQLTGIVPPPRKLKPAKDIVVVEETVISEPKPKKKVSRKRSTASSKKKKKVSTKKVSTRKGIEQEIEEEKEKEEEEEIEGENDLATEKGMMEELKRLGFDRLSTKRRKAGDGTYPMYAKQVNEKKDGFSKEMNIINIIKVLGLPKSGKKSDIIGRIKDALRKNGYQV